MLRLAQERDRLTVINDQFGAPTGADLIADITAHTIRQVMNPGQSLATSTGLYHLVASGETTWFDYEKHVLAQATAKSTAITLKAREVTPVETSAFPTPARRPHNSRLATDKLRHTFGLTMPAWQVGVNRMLDEIL